MPTSANDRIGVGLIGCGERGRGLASYITRIGGAEVRAVSDVFAPRREQAAAQLGSTAKAVADYREILESKDIDAVVIATPDHWHARMTIAAVWAGKDVYVEKPVTHTLAEGERLLMAVLGSGRAVSTGTQQRSWDHFIEAKRLMDDGELGNVTFVRCHWHQNHLPRDAPRMPEIDLAQLDWNGWLGPAPAQPFDSARFHYWRFFWDFGGGSVGDLMTHWIDVVQWFMNSPAASAVQAVGKTYALDWLETPDTVTATMVFPEGFTVTFESSLVFGLEGARIVFRGDRAMMTLDRHGYAVYEEGAMPFEAPGLPRPSRRYKRPKPRSWVERMDGSGTKANIQHWLDCIRHRWQPRAGLRAGVEAANTAHRVNEALRGSRAR